MNFQLGDGVVYGIHGVCRIVDVESRRVDRKTVEYYVLSPCAQPDARFYVPVHNQAALAKMRKLLTTQELEDLLTSNETQQDSWIPEENLRRERYRQLMARGTCGELMGMIRALNRHRQQQLEAGRKFHMSDENFLKDARRVVSTEVAQILTISVPEAEEYLQNRLDRE